MSKDDSGAGAAAGVSLAEHAQPTRTKNRNGMKVLGGLLALTLLTVAAVGGYVFFLGKSFDDNSTKLTQDEVFTDEQPEAADGDPINVLLLGSDARDSDIDYEDGARGNRSDTIMVMHINGDRSGVQVMSIPRDMWVPIKGHGNAKINAAMSYGGLPLATQTIGEFIDAPIHHVAIIDFEGFKALTESVGGVEVESEQAFSSRESTFTEGANHVNGDEALDFVRARKEFADGDLQRARNQQAFLKGLTSKIISADTLANPGKVSGMVRDFAPYMTMDEKLTASNIAGLAYQMRDVRPGEIQFYSAPIAGAGTSADGQAILNVSKAEQERIQEAFNADSVDEYAENAGTVHL